MNPKVFIMKKRHQFQPLLKMRMSLKMSLSKPEMESEHQLA